MKIPYRPEPFLRIEHAIPKQMDRFLIA